MKMTQAEFSRFIRNLGIWVDERSSTKNRGRYNSALSVLHDVLVDEPVETELSAADYAKLDAAWEAHKAARPIETFPLEAGGDPACDAARLRALEDTNKRLRERGLNEIKLVAIDFEAIEARALLRFAQQFPNCKRLREARGEAFSPGAWCAECAKLGYCKGRFFAI